MAPLRRHCGANSMPLRRYFDATVAPLWHPCDAIQAPLWRHPGATLTMLCATTLAPPWRHFDAAVCHHPGTTLAPPWPHVRGFYIYTSFTSFLHQFYHFTSLWHYFILVLWARLYNYRNNGYNRCIDAYKYLNIWRNNRQCL